MMLAQQQTSNPALLVMARKCMIGNGWVNCSAWGND
jgi:hypothetical protein